MCPESFSVSAGPLQGSPWQRPRRCLLKGCDHWFRPTRPQCRYCSAACQQAACRWRRWRAQQKYRQSGNGRQHRQQQARRYRQRRPAPVRPPPEPPQRHEAPDVAASAAFASSEGKRLGEKSAEVPQRPCDRPGCYVLFAAGASYNPRRFCCSLCRRALRRVLDREAHRRQRRRRGLRPCGRRRQRPPHRRE
jgi:hypothetical protein